MNTLLSGEEVILESNDKTLVLTNMRIVVKRKFISSYIFLEEISSIDVFAYGDIYYLVTFSVLIFTLEHFLLPMGSDNILIIAQFVSCAVVFLLWLMYHRSVIVIALKNGKKTDIMVAKSAADKIPGFIARVQEEKAKRIKDIYS